MLKSLERAGIVTCIGPDGFRSLTARAMKAAEEFTAPTPRELFEAYSLDPFEGGDGGDSGSTESPSTWVFGIEHGDPTKVENENSEDRYSRNYSIDRQLTFPYNRNAFKLFAAIEGRNVAEYKEIAHKNQPWVPGSLGYLKGNLYPYPCYSVETWSDVAKSETGFESKDDYIDWCNKNRLPAIADAVRHFRPRLFIGVGTSFANEFAIAFCGSELDLETYSFAVNGYVKNIRHAEINGQVLVVIPHLSGGKNGLNSNVSLQIAGGFIAELIR